MKIDREAIYRRDNGLCGFCGQSVPWELLHLDHVQPRALGGPTTPENLRVAHRKCNIKAGHAVRDERRRLGLPVLPQPGNGVRIILTFPPELALQVRDLAERERRPLSTQIQVLVERALERSTQAAAA